MSDTAVIFDIIGRDRTAGALRASGSAFNKFALGIAAGAAFAADRLINMAGNFQAAMTRVQTGAGEAAGNMKLVSAGVLDMSGEVGQSATHLASALYTVESAGYHGAQALEVLHAAAEGATVGVAETATVTDAVTTALNAYHLGAGKAVEVTNALIGAESQGKTNMEALAGSLANVLPTAAAAHVGLNEVLGAMSTMTAEGVPAANAATYLRQVIGQLSNPSGKAAAEMKSLGLNATKVGLSLGKRGLAATLTMLTDAIEKHMGPAGTVLIKHLRDAAKNTTAYQKVLADLPPAQQTYIGALATMVGGTKSMQAALMLTGDNMKTFQANTVGIAEHVKEGGGAIEGWAVVQKNFNQRVAEAKATVQALGIRIGTALLPPAQKMLGVVMSAVMWFTKHKTVARDLAIGIGVLAAGFVAFRIGVTAVNAATKTWMVVTKLAAAAQWLLNVAMDANPIGLIIIAIVALAAGIYLLWTHSKGFRDFFIGLWGHIWSFLKMIGAWFAGPFAGFFVTVGKAIAAPFLWLWHQVLVPAWQAIVAEFQFAMRIITSFANLFAFLWRNTVGAAMLWLWHSIITPVWKGIAAGALWLWHNVLDPVWHGIMAGVDFVGGVMSWLWRHVMVPAWNGITAAVGFAWGVLEKIFGKVMSVVRTVGGVFKSIFNAVKGYIVNAFHDAVSIVKGVINSLIGMLNSASGLINRNVIDKLNAVPGVDFPHVPSIPKLARGGIVTGPTLALLGEGGHPERVQPLDGSENSAGQARLILDVRGADEDLKRLVLKWLRVDPAFRATIKSAVA